jgi:hypothetical protein
MQVNHTALLVEANFLTRYKGQQRPQQVIFLYNFTESLHKSQTYKGTRYFWELFARFSIVKYFQREVLMFGSSVDNRPTSGLLCREAEPAVYRSANARRRWIC